MANDTFALEVRALSKSFGSVVAARNLNVQVSPGTVVSIIGTNGAGKTTFINMVTGYVRPDSGDVWFSGRNITGWTPRAIVRSGLGRSFQIPQLFYGISVFENMLAAVAIGRLRPRSFMKGLTEPSLVEFCESMLDAFGLLGYRDQLPENLSGGTRKLLDIAMAFAAEPKMLLLDEPTSGVSEEEKHPLMEQVLAVTTRAGLTTMLVEHDMEIVEEFSDRVLAFYAGEIIADGRPEAVFEDERVQEIIIGA